MSWEAWGDDGDDYMDQAQERLADAGWLSKEEADELRKRVAELETVLRMARAVCETHGARDTLAIIDGTLAA